MANRAYLYFAETIDPVCCDRNKVRYFDSRHNIPFSWWFFFDTQSLKFKPESFNWIEPWLVRSWEDAKKQFVENFQRIVTLTQQKVTVNDLECFIESLSSFSNQHIKLDGTEIFQADDYKDVNTIEKILHAVEKNTDTSLQCAQMIDSCTNLFKSKETDNILNTIGYTYW